MAKDKNANKRFIGDKYTTSKGKPNKKAQKALDNLFTNTKKKSK